MKIKFTGKTMPRYQGHDGSGNTLDLAKGETADVTDAVGKLLLSRYRENFSQVAEEPEAPQMVPDADKQLNDSKKPRIKLRSK